MVIEMVVATEMMIEMVMEIEMVIEMMIEMVMKYVSLTLKIYSNFHPFYLSLNMLKRENFKSEKYFKSKIRLA